MKFIRQDAVVVVKIVRYMYVGVSLNLIYDISITVEMTYVSSEGASSDVLTPNRALKGHTCHSKMQISHQLLWVEVV